MKKKKQIKELTRAFNELKRVFNGAVHRNFDLLSENARLRSEMDEAIKNFSTMRYENQKLRTENDLARIQLQDAQEKMQKPVFIPID